MKSLKKAAALPEIRKALRALQDPKRAKVSAWFFKTGKGQYGEGDQFLGIRVPEIRGLVKQYKNTALTDIESLVKSAWHEERLLGWLLLVRQFQDQKNELSQKKLVDFYLTHTRFCNNWDLVDSTAHQMLGAWLLDRPTSLLKKLARSSSLWERRISIVATYAFIRRGRFEDTFKMATLLLNDSEDLIHKAVGWMLREVGKHGGETALELFLQQHLDVLPRTTLRYAIERLPPLRRGLYLKGALSLLSRS